LNSVEGEKKKKSEGKGSSGLAPNCTKRISEKKPDNAPRLKITGKGGVTEAGGEGKWAKKSVEEKSRRRRKENERVKDRG